jgi:hypothetical protein
MLAVKLILNRSSGCSACGLLPLGSSDILEEITKLWQTARTKLDHLTVI